jgi:acetyltransferase-like isoleucine patch superfamily enzyme
VVGAGAVITKDIPPYEIWAGVPARKIISRKHYERDMENVLSATDVATPERSVNAAI